MGHFNLVTALVVIAMLVVLCGCESLRPRGEASPAPVYPSFDWTASVTGSGKDVTGGSLSVAAAKTPAPVEQLEKGNARKVAAQVTAKADVDKDVGVYAPASVEIPYALPTDGRSRDSGSSGAAWYNGFL